MTELAILLAVLVIAAAVGLVYRRRAGRVRSVAPGEESRTRAALLADAGVHSVPTVLHFSADWCGPCAAVRRVVGQVVADLAPSAREVELDLDEHPALAKELGVMSLPTTFIFDAAATERFRISGVPSRADLRSALTTLI